MTLLADLAATVGDDRVRAAARAWIDIGGFDVGKPAAVVRPRTTDEVAAIVRTARARRVPVVPVGARTAYWRPLDLRDAIAVDLSDLSDHHVDDDVVIAGAGAAVRPLDTALRRVGLCLPVHPDAFGETGVGAMVASGLTSGIGMARGSMDACLTGLTVVTGTGAIVRTGTGWSFDGLPPFQRDGLPDPTGLFVGSEGTLGIVTEVALRARPTPWMVQVHGHHAHPDAVLAAGRTLLRQGLCDTFRALRQIEPARGDTLRGTPWTVDVWVDSALDAPDAFQRAERVADTLRRAGMPDPTLRPEPDAVRTGHDPLDDPRWQGPIGSHARFMDTARLVGFDVNAPWSQSAALLRLADEQADAARALGPLQIRSALYLAPGFLNLGLHTTVPHDTDADAVRAHHDRFLTALAAIPAVPYRPGHVWPAAALDRRHAPFADLMAQVRRTLDPDGILAPTHPLAGR